MMRDILIHFKKEKDVAEKHHRKIQEIRETKKTRGKEGRRGSRGGGRKDRPAGGASPP